MLLLCVSVVDSLVVTSFQSDNSTFLEVLGPNCFHHWREVSELDCDLQLENHLYLDPDHDDHHWRELSEIEYKKISVICDL